MNVVTTFFRSLNKNNRQYHSVISDVRKDQNKERKQIQGNWKVSRKLFQSSTKIENLLFWKVTPVNASNNNKIFLGLTAIFKSFEGIYRFNQNKPSGA